MYRSKAHIERYYWETIKWTLKLLDRVTTAALGEGAVEISVIQGATECKYVDEVLTCRWPRLLGAARRSLEDTMRLGYRLLRFIGRKQL